MKNRQNFEYRVYDSNGRVTDIVYYAHNISEAFKLFKEDRINYSKYYYGKLQREYERGYHISEDKR